MWRCPSRAAESGLPPVDVPVLREGGRWLDGQPQRRLRGDYYAPASFVFGVTAGAARQFVEQVGRERELARRAGPATGASSRRVRSYAAMLSVSPRRLHT